MSAFARGLATLTVDADHDWNPKPRHGPIEKLTEDVYFVRGRMPSAPGRPLVARALVYYSRTMAVVRVREPGGRYHLTLLNTLRLDSLGLRALDELGEVRHVVRLGAFHGVDDAFFVKQYPLASYWHMAGMSPARGLAVVPKVMSAEALPIPGAVLHEFRGVNFPEAVLVLPRTAERQVGVAVSCDSIQNHRSAFDKDNSWPVSFGIWKLGLLGKARLGPFWLQEQVPLGTSTAVAEEPSGCCGGVKGSPSLSPSTLLRPVFEELLKGDWDALVPGHGWPMDSGAKQAVRASVDEQLPVVSSPSKCDVRAS